MPFLRSSTSEKLRNMFVYVAKFFETIATAPPNEYFIHDIFLSGNKLGESLHKTNMKNVILTELL